MVVMTGHRKAAALSLASQFRALFREDGNGKDSWFDAALNTPVAGKAYMFTDRIDASHCMLQALSSLQVATPTADAAMGDALTASFTSAPWYDSNRPSSAWRFIHDGTGMELWLSALYTDANGRIGLATSAAQTIQQVGLQLYYVANNAQMYLSNGLASYLISALGWGYPPSAPTFVSVSMSATASPQARIETSLATNPGALSGSPTTENPYGPLRLGAAAGVGSYAIGMRWRGLYTFRRVLSDAERTIVRQFVSADMGIS